MKFEVIDNTTGECPDLYQIATTEPWAKNLLAYDIDGFLLEQDGSLILMDDCNNIAFCPVGRFTVIFESGV